MMSVFRLQVEHLLCVIRIAVLPVGGRCVVPGSRWGVLWWVVLGGCVWSIFYCRWGDE